MIAILLSLLVTVASTAGTSAVDDSVSITYVGNEGFLIESGGKKVLIDALYRTGVSGYVVHSPEVRKQLERALPPFDDVDLVLATHYHADHFDPNAVGVHLLSNRDAIFVTTNQAAGQMERYKGFRNIQARVTGVFPQEGEDATIEHNGITVRALNLHHGRDRPIENLGFVIEMDGVRFLHVGDTEARPDEFAAYGLSDMAIDFFFVPYWFLLGDGSDGIVGAINAANVIPMHIPPRDDPRGYLRDTGGFDATIALIESNHTNTLTFSELMTTRTFP